MYSISLNDNNLSFKTLEQNIYKMVCDIACDVFKEVLETLDRLLMSTRDVEKYRHKGIKKTHIHTIMGVIEYGRRIYECYNDDNKKGYIFLLDQYLNNETVGHVSTNLAEKIVERALEESYRKTAEAMESTTNTNLSHTTAWNVVQKVGGKIEEKEQQLIGKHEQGKLNGDREVEVLFQEADGVWLCMQGKDRPAKGKRKELKVAINYEGWRNRKGQEDEYEVYNKTACASFNKGSEFKKLWEAKVAQKYNVDEIKLRIVNGDGDAWIKPDLNEEGVHFQLDPFHIAKSILGSISDKKQAKEINKLIKEGQTDKVFDVLTKLLIEYNNEEEEFKKIEKLYNYLSNNREGLKPYQLRDIRLPKLPNGLEYRGMGTMEADICNIIALRMKNRKMSWSEKGGNNLAKLLTARASGKLYKQLDGIFDGTVSETMQNEIIEVVQLSAAQANRMNKGNGTNPIKTVPMPYEGQPLTEGRKAIRDLVKNRVIHDLRIY